MRSSGSSRPRARQLSASLYIWSATRRQVARVSRRLPVALRVGDWTAVLAMLDDANLPDTDKTANLRFLRDELRNFAAGMQALGRGDLRRRRWPLLKWMPGFGARVRTRRLQLPQKRSRCR